MVGMYRDAVLRPLSRECGARLTAARCQLRAAAAGGRVRHRLWALLFRPLKIYVSWKKTQQVRANVRWAVAATGRDST